MSGVKCEDCRWVQRTGAGHPCGCLHPERTDLNKCWDQVWDDKHKGKCSLGERKVEEDERCGICEHRNGFMQPVEASFCELAPGRNNE